jgi:inner membrane protein
MTTPSENKSFFEKLNNWIKNSITIKLFSIGIIILLLLIPSFMVEELIRESQYTSEDAINEVGSKWGLEQIITGPVITVPYTTVIKDDKNQLISATQYAHFLPEKINIKGNVIPEKRHRGIYEIVVYKSTLNYTGTFLTPKAEELNIDPKNFQWKDAFVQIGISDMKGINENIELRLNDVKYMLDPGISTTDIVESGVSTKINLPDSAQQFTYSFDLNLNGSKKLYFVPLGKENNIDISSSWKTPSFDGAFIPESHDVTENGFKAKWKVLHLNRNFPQQWVSNDFKVSSSAFGITFLIAVDHYLKSTRAAKYAILIIALTFMGFFFVEIINKKRIHPFQYILVGLSICIFYALLLAFSEHIGFNYSYILSMILVVGAITYYSKHMFENNKTTVLLSAVLLIIYGFIYVIIQLEDFALLMGSIGLFIVLILTMHLSRKIKWYNE